MSMINKGIPYFPISANFFEEEVMELVEAKFGILASYIVLRLLCKIYKEGYYISWGKEQNLIFARKIGEGIKEDMIEKIVELLLEKEFFHKRDVRPIRSVDFGTDSGKFGWKLRYGEKLITPSYLIY